MDDWAGFGSETEFEDYIRELLLLANSPEALGLTGEPEPKSPKFLARERKLLADPFGYARKVLRPLWRKVLTTAACLVLAVTVAFGGLMAASPTARAWVSRIVTEWLEEYVRFSFGETAYGEIGKWRPDYLPENYKEWSADDYADLREVIFTNLEGERIIFQYSKAGEESWIGIDNEKTNYRAIETEGKEGHMLQAADSLQPSQFLWVDEDRGIAFLLMGQVAPEELIAIAASVEQVS